MQKKITLDISQVAKLTGLPASTLRYYDDKGLIRSIGRVGLKRIFHGNVIEQLSLISLGRYAGFSLDAIAAMFSPSGKPTINREQLLEKADQLERSIEQFKAMRDGLRHVANCPEPNQLECPKFQRLVRKAAKSQFHEAKQRSIK